MLWIASQLAHRLAHSDLLLQFSKRLGFCETSLNLASIYLNILKCFKKNLKIREWALGRQGKQGKRLKVKGKRNKFNSFAFSPVGELACPELCRRVEPYPFPFPHAPFAPYPIPNL
ncbi:hypothetical protein VF14_15040 [Nostoc linckia z18]|uniref:Uncharacterized protein n=2 Tax=Nostoc linckia TaxID=92942 RepID=A0A9Q6ELR7_NOSLI|nr:hypothetical protein VF02_09470 [Nostoc linckia z1]PHJ68961.1 hypothetical protein VF05_15105 [Nostoc linckia z3]PHJ74612.1 hypothetical protein VF03_13930 [Nostoc linckia z2]PHJ85504.1 hypothetical protein VF07_23225 [Nostoc linckia z6]PHJ87113.1 hypothetical protein VF06_02090 [Nostoc linckia z4]PHJ97485.1 hypothetical protein VF04_12265 [Nostoc linckia z7]PHK02314.1 hypothetical protein VF09_31790 [Nostoc linckia z9]PHK04651.1 hypothetical protein VF08_10505 [Nostoc linckia z8]PHK2017